MGSVLLEETAARTPSLRDRVITLAKESFGYIALAGGAFFALARMALSPFYAQYDLDPSEAGWSTTEVLNRFALPWVLLLALGIFVLAMAVSARAKMVAFARWLAQINGLGPWILFGLILLPLICPFVLFVEDYQRTSERISAGRAASSGLGLDLLPVVASCVRVTPTSGASPTPSTTPATTSTSAPIAIDPTKTYVYLGHADGTLVLYDAKDGRTRRIPASGQVVSSARCRPVGSSPTPYRLRKPLLGVFLVLVVVTIVASLWRRLVTPLVPMSARRTVHQLTAATKTRSTEIGVRRPVTTSDLQWFLRFWIDCILPRWRPGWKIDVAEATDGTLTISHRLNNRLQILFSPPLSAIAVLRPHLATSAGATFTFTVQPYGDFVVITESVSFGVLAFLLVDVGALDVRQLRRFEKAVHEAWEPASNDETETRAGEGAAESEDPGGASAELAEAGRS